jgi:hypothetical protein
MARQKQPNTGRTGRSFLFALVTAVLGTALAVAVNLVTNRVPKSWRWASNGWVLVGIVAGLAVLGAVLAWWHQPPDEESRPAPDPASTGSADQPEAGSVLFRPWQLWAAAIVFSVLAVGLATLAALSRSKGPDELTAVLIVLGVLIAVTVALAWRASGQRPSPAGIIHSSAGGRAKVTPRSLLLEKVEQLWIRDALHRSLQQAVLLDVGLDSQPDALADRFDDWGSGRLERLGASEPLPSGTALLDLLGQAVHHRCLLIGEPGSGKTTHLLQLAEDLIDEARAGPPAAIPVVLLLSRWAHAYPDLQSWLCAEIGERYDIVPSQVGEWLVTGSVTLLLDGLDEVGPGHRNECIQAVNAFCRDPSYAGTGLVLACRTHDYEVLEKRLRFDVAVRVRPLSTDQVDRALNTAGPDFDGLRQSLVIDSALRDLLTTPLMLGVAVLAYRGAPAATPVPAGRPGELRELMYGEFVRRMLSRDRSLRDSRAGAAGRAPFDPQHTYVSLVWLAKMMLAQQQTVFYPDWLTPAWLPQRNTDWPLPPARGFAGWLAARLGWDHASTGIVGSRLAALVGAVAAAPLGALAGGPWAAILLAVVCALALGLGVGITFGILLQVPVLNRLFIPFLGSEEEDPYAASSWTWSWVRALRGLLVWSASGMIAIGIPLGIARSWAAGMTAALLLGFGGALSTGSEPDLTEPPASPGRALQASLRQLAYLLVILLAAAVPAATISLAIKGPWTAIVASLPVTAALMLTAGPGRAWLRSRAVSFGIHKAQLLPRNLVVFLRHADERVILQRTFGGFAFIHRTLRDYLADQQPASAAFDHMRRR